MTTSSPTFGCRALLRCLLLGVAVCVAACGGGAGEAAAPPTSGAPAPTPGPSPAPSPAPAPPPAPGLDTVPDPFSFAPVTDARAGAFVASAAVTITGIEAPSPVGIEGGEYSVDGAPFTASPGSIAAGAKLAVRVPASIDEGETTIAVLSVGGVASAFAVTTSGTRLVANKRVGLCPPAQSCAGTAFNSLAALAASLRPGDVADVYPADTPYPAVRFNQAGTAAAPIIVRGMRVGTKLPVIQGGESSSTGFAAVYLLNAHYTTLDSFEITNGINRRKPDGSIDKGRYDSPDQCVKLESNFVTLRRSTVRDCPNHGVLGTDTGNGTVTLDRVEITTSGCNPSGMSCDDGKHPIYIATDLQQYPGAVLRVVDSHLHDNIAGETVKSRAHRVELYNNWIETRGRFEARALGLYGHDEVKQASLNQPIHHDIVGNVLIVDGANTPANSVARFGSDFELSEANGNTFGRTRFVNNTVVVSGRFGDHNASAPIIRLFGRIEGFIAHNNIVHVAGPPQGKVVLLHEDDENLAWAATAAPAGVPRVLLTHNHLPAGSTVLRDRSFASFGANDVPPQGYAWESWLILGAGPPLVDAGDIAALSAAKLRLAPGSPLRGKGTSDTNRARHPVDTVSEFSVPGALRLPQRNAPDVSAGTISVGSPRSDADAPSVGAYD